MLQKVLVLVLGLVIGRSAYAQPAKKPNIIYILCDDLGYGDIGVLYQNARTAGNAGAIPAIQTPHIDAMAKAGATLTAHYAAAPVCAPSRASFLLGQSQGHANVRDNQFDKALADNYNVARVLKTAGYATVAIGKWGLQGQADSAWTATPRQRGFDDFFGYMRHSDGHEHYPKEGLYRGTKQVWHNGKNITPSLDGCYTGDLWTAYAKQWIAGHVKKSRQPFFMYLAYDTPHAVLELPAMAYPAGGGLKGGIQWFGHPGRMINTAGGVPDSYIFPPYATATYKHADGTQTTLQPWPDTYKRYATAVTRLSYMVNDLRALLADLKLADNTLIVFTSDNGPSNESYLPKPNVPNRPDFFESFGPFDGIKRDTWEGGIRMPAFVVWPGHISPEKFVNKPSANYCWLATFAQAAGVPPPAVTDGESILPALTGTDSAGGNVYIEYYEEGQTPNLPEFAAVHRNRRRGQMQMVRLNNYVGVRYNVKTGAEPFEIYNILKDPKQLHDLANQPGMAALGNQMQVYALQNRQADAEAPRPYDNIAVPSSPGLDTGSIYMFIPGPSVCTKPGYSMQPASAWHVLQGLGQLPVPPADGTYFIQKGFRARMPGFYSFTLAGNSPCVAKIHNAMVLDNDYAFTPNRSVRGVLNLAQGVHPVTFSIAVKKGIKPELTFYSNLTAE